MWVVYFLEQLNLLLTQYIYVRRNIVIYALFLSRFTFRPTQERSLHKVRSIKRSIKKIWLAYAYYAPEFGLCSCLFKYAWYTYPILPEGKYQHYCSSTLITYLSFPSSQSLTVPSAVRDVWWDILCRTLFRAIWNDYSNTISITSE
jgi:hypothetical protein